MRHILIAILVTAAATTAHADNWNVRTSPAALFAVKLANIRADYKIASRWSLGIEIGNQSYDDGETGLKARTYGAYATLYLNEAMESGWFVDFGGTYGTIEGELVYSGATLKNDTTNTGLRVLGGYHWFWQPFNISLGFGYAANSEDKLDIKDNNGAVIRQADLQPTSLAADLSIGLSF